MLKDALNKKMWLWFGVCLNLALLGYYKYANFFVGNMNDVFGSNHIVPNILLPIGISFFTFQQIAYLVDLSKQSQKLPSYRDYALFVTFFPQLIAGPIVHYREMIPQFNKINVNYSNLYLGLSIFFIGLFKKAVIADNLALYANPVFEGADRGEMMSFIPAWSAALAYTFQIYFDFSGYSDMAIGLARMFGIKMPENFRSPYRSLSIIDFWRRWHITLSRFLKDYLYIPLGGNRTSKPRRYLNLMIVMLLGGLWHGAGWSFIVWGALHGVYLIVNHTYRHMGQCMPIKIPDVLSWFVTFVSCVVAWVYFRATNFEAANNIVKSMFDFKNIELSHSVYDRVVPIVGGDYGLFSRSDISHFPSFEMLGMIAFAAFVCLFWTNTQGFFRNNDIVLRSEENNETPKRGVRVVWNDKSFFWLLSTAFIAAIAILSSNSKVQFIYFQF